MSSKLKAGTSTSGAVLDADTTGILELQTGSTPTTAVTIDTSQKVGIGTTSPSYRLHVSGNGSGTNSRIGITNTGTSSTTEFGNDANGGFMATSGAFGNLFYTNDVERMRIDSSGNVLIGTTDSAGTRVGATSGDGTVIQAASYSVFSRNASSSGQTVIAINTTGVDSRLIDFYAQGTSEGNISVSGTTVSYNGGHLARWSQLLDGSKDDTILKGTVLSNLDDMCVWVKNGQELPNEQLNKMKVSDAEGDTNVAGVFVNWTRDEQCNTDDMNVAMTGDMIIRIAQSVVVQKGDLLMSAGDGTAKPQGDDIRKSKTIAKVTSNNVTCTYADGSYCVPCVLMAC